MSMMDDAANLRALIQQVPTAAIREMTNTVMDVNSRAAGIIGATAGFQGIGNAAVGLTNALEAAVAACYQFESAIEDAADFLTEQGGG